MVVAVAAFLFCVFFPMLSLAGEKAENPSRKTAARPAQTKYREQEPPMNWYDKVFRKMIFELNPTSKAGHASAPIGKNFDAEKLAETLKASGAQAIVFFAKDAQGYCYYPTRVGKAYPQMHSRDFLGEAIAACHARSIRVIAYFHSQSTAGEGDFCVSNPDMLKWQLSHLEEICKNYEVDGVFMDGYPFRVQPHGCEYCRKSYGGAIPQHKKPDPVAWPKYLKWKRRRVREWANQVAETIHRARPGALVGINWMAANRYCETPPEGVDFLTADYPMSADYPFKDNIAFATSYQLAGWSWRSLPAEVMTTRMLGWWSDWTYRPTTAIKVDFALALARCGRLHLGDIAHPKTILPDEEGMKLAANVFEFARQREHLAAGARPIADIAVLSSETTYIGTVDRIRGDDSPQKGAFLALGEAGFTCHILLEADLEKHLSKYKTLVIPEQPLLEPSSAKTIGEFVRAGGGLAVTGPAATKLLSKVLGVEDKGLFEGDRWYVKPGDETVSLSWPSHEPVRPPILVHGRPPRIRPVTAEKIMPLVRADSSVALGGGPPGERTDYPGVTLNHFGKGRAAFCVLPLARDYWARGNSWAKYLTVALVKLVTPAPTVTIQAPVDLEVTLAEKKDAIIVHLVAYRAGMRPGNPPVIERIAPVTDVTVRLRVQRRPRAVYLEPGRRKAKWSYEKGIAVIKIPKVEIHAAVLVEYK